VGPAKIKKDKAKTILTMILEFVILHQRSVKRVLSGEDF
jgi:hypothetical protein